MGRGERKEKEVGKKEIKGGKVCGGRVAEWGEENRKEKCTVEENSKVVTTPVLKVP